MGYSPGGAATGPRNRWEPAAVLLHSSPVRGQGAFSASTCTTDRPPAAEPQGG